MVDEATTTRKALQLFHDDAGYRSLWLWPTVCDFVNAILLLTSDEYWLLTAYDKPGLLANGYPSFPARMTGGELFI